MITVNELIYTLIAERRHATNGEIQQIIAHVAQDLSRLTSLR